MKQKKSIAKRPARVGTQHAKRAVRAGRPLHKRVLLHPFTVMVLLCAGVLIVGTTIRSFAVSYNVTATVPAAIPTQPATISAPATSQHFAAPLALVNGACPDQTYVKLFRNAAFSGVAQCTGNSFQIQTSLVSGANELNVQVYNLTDQAGPASSPVTVYYDETSETPPAPPANVPTTMWVSQLDGNGYKGATQTTSDNPTVSGWAPPFAMVTVTFHSDPLTCTTQADSTGWWTCTLDRTLPAGLHNVIVVAVTSTGEKLTAPTFKINVRPALPSLLLKPAASPLVVRADYHYQMRVGLQASNLDVALAGGTAPYTVKTDWGDGTTTTVTRPDDSPFTITHIYPTSAGANKDYTVLVHATDSEGLTALMQLSVVVKGAGLMLLASNSTFNQFLNGVHHWLWLIWPTYAIVVLMAIGYYLGEREEYRHLMAKKRAHGAGRLK